MPVVLLLALITVSEATIGVFVKLTGDAIPIQTLNFYALTFAAAFLALAIPHATGSPLRLPRGNVKDTVIIGALIAAQIRTIVVLQRARKIATRVRNRNSNTDSAKINGC